MLGLAVESFVWPIAIIVYTYQPKIVKSCSKNDAMKAPVLLIIIKKNKFCKLLSPFVIEKPSQVISYQVIIVTARAFDDNHSFGISLFTDNLP